MVPARLNPFRTECLEALPFRFRAGWDWARLTRSLAEHHWRGAIVGPHGSGKTTLLEQLAERQRATGKEVCSVRLGEATDAGTRAKLVDQARSLGPGTLVILDGAEQLDGWQWRRLLRNLDDRCGLVVSTHQPGRLPTVYEMESSVALLRELGGVLLPGGVAQPDWPALHRRFRGNVREVFRDCYEAFGRRGGTT